MRWQTGLDDASTWTLIGDEVAMDTVTLPILDGCPTIIYGKVNLGLQFFRKKKPVSFSSSARGVTT